ncbi:MAG: hypothetical protein L0Z62_36135, partial [Gemmataceae bacterium]|nr:hypothetical protein [Gemmataceae bacterium]
GNFTSIGNPDLALLFDLYDAGFFGGKLRQTLQTAGSLLHFRLAARMTRAGGKTTMTRPRRAPGQGASQPPHFEIAISTTLLFQTYQDIERTVRINGFVCADRLQALQRIMEHELVHLIEFLVWQRSRCTADNFQQLARRLFAHTDVTHDLVTQRERAQAKFDIRVGDRVRFEFEGKAHVGVVNRITRRATVLVEDPRGQRYTDGKRYLKFYIPLVMLEKV